MRFGEEIDQGFGDNGADAVDRRQPNDRILACCCVLHRLGRTEGPGQIARRHLANMADAEREQEAIEANAAPLVDGGEQFVDTLFLETGQRQQRLAPVAQPEQRDRPFDQPLVGEQF